MGAEERIAKVTTEVKVEWTLKEGEGTPMEAAEAMNAAIRAAVTEHLAGRSPSEDPQPPPPAPESSTGEGVDDTDGPQQFFPASEHDCRGCGADWITGVETLGAARRGGGYARKCKVCGDQWDDRDFSYGDRDAEVRRRSQESETGDWHGKAWSAARSHLTQFERHFGGSGNEHALAQMDVVASEIVDAVLAVLPDLAALTAERPMHDGQPVTQEMWDELSYRFELLDRDHERLAVALKAREADLAALRASIPMHDGEPVTQEMWDALATERDKTVLTQERIRRNYERSQERVRSWQAEVERLTAERDRLRQEFATAMDRGDKFERWYHDMNDERTRLAAELAALRASIPEVPDGHELWVVPVEVSDDYATGQFAESDNPDDEDLVKAARAAIARRPKPEPEWHCEADAVGLHWAGICSPENPIHSSPCGRRPGTVEVLRGES